MTDPKPLTERAIREILELLDGFTDATDALAEGIHRLLADNERLRKLGRDPAKYEMSFRLMAALASIAATVQNAIASGDDTDIPMCRPILEDPEIAAWLDTVSREAGVELLDLRASVEDGGEGA